MSEGRIKPILLAAGALGTALLCLAPILVMVLTAVAERPDFLAPDQHFAPTLDHARAVLFAESAHFLAYLRNSLIVSAVTAAVSVLVAALAAYAFTRLALPARGPLLLGVLAISMFPPISLVPYLFKLMTALGWVNTYVALVLPYVAWTLPLSLWILVSDFARIPRDLDRAALVDGCSRIQALVRVIMPVAAPAVLSTGLLAFIFAFNEFLLALMLTTDHHARTIPVGIALFEGLHGQVPWGQIMAAATITVLPVVGLTLLFQRRIVQGLTRGAVKG